MTTVNHYADYDAARQRISKKTHTQADEALVATWESGGKLALDNKRLIAAAESHKADLKTAHSTITKLSARCDILESRGTPTVSLSEMLSVKEKSQS